MKTRLRIGAIVLIGTFASGCAAKGYDTGELRRHLVGAGVPAAAAACVVNGMTLLFGHTRLVVYDVPSAEELAAQRRLLRTCGAR